LLLDVKKPFRSLLQSSCLGSKSEGDWRRVLDRVLTSDGTLDTAVRRARIWQAEAFLKTFECPRGQYASTREELAQLITEECDDTCLEDLGLSRLR